MVLAFEPEVVVDGEAFYLEDMVLVLEHGSEVLTPGLPYTADEIERAMAR
jgi:Xaa-Pro aminopeptidase